MATDDVLHYHIASKHRLDRYAPGPGRLDWANQPEPFRWFTGAKTVELPLAADALPTRYRAVRGGGELPAPHDFDLRSIAILFELSLGLSAWKSFGASRWALRCNPSSGNLHPTEGYLLCPALPGLPGGVYHYLSRDHALERRAQPQAPRWEAAFPARGVLVGISSIFWREAWKYGVRAWRYCQHDCGHAIAALAYAAASLGWRARLIDTASDASVASLLGLDRDADFAGAEPETGEALLWIGDDGAPEPDALVRALAAAEWSGHANRLSAAHARWPEIDAIHRATAKPATAELPTRRPSPRPPPADPDGDPLYATLARQRRSAVAFDGKTRIGERAFFAMLDALLPRETVAPWSALATPSSVHVALLVHRVSGLEPGLYVLLRDSAALSALRACLRSEWPWDKTGPPHLPLYRLLAEDLRAIASLICCHQDIAADSCFALAMLAPVEAVRDVPWRYRHLFWECGMLGQALYLEAEAAGLRATGIGCYFDDAMHELLGITDPRWQSLYHFTIGGPREDPRLTTSAPYPARGKATAP